MSTKQVYFVTGGSADVGLGAVAALLEQNHSVATLTRKADTAKELRQKHAAAGDRFLVVEGDLSSLEGTKKVWETVLAKFGHVNHVIASVGGWQALIQKNKLVESDPADLLHAIHVLTTPQLHLAKVILPVLAEQKDSSYTIITGGAPNFYMSPGWGLIAAAGGALHGLSTTLRGDFKEAAVRVNEARVSLRVLQQEKVSNPWEVTNLDLGKALVGLSLSSDIKGQVLPFTNQKEVDAFAEKVKKA